MPRRRTERSARSYSLGGRADDRRFCRECLGAGGRPRWVAAVRSCPVAADDNDDDDPENDSVTVVLTNVMPIGRADRCRAEYCAKRRQIRFLARAVCAPAESFLDGDRSVFVFKGDFTPLGAPRVSYRRPASVAFRRQKQKADDVK